MLYGYPIKATSENWLHDCLYEMLQTIHLHLQMANSPPDWPDIIPEKYRERLRTRKGLKDRLIAYQEKVKTLTYVEQTKIYQALIDENEIANLLACTHHCDNIDNLPESIHQSLKELFKFSFKDLLTDLGIRDKHYRIIYNATKHHTCPFCGCEYFDAPTGPRESLDHYLLESKYPFAATNLRNLVPMCNKCNSRHKHVKDILYDDKGVRRKSFDPYNHKGVKLSLQGSLPFKGKDELPEWQIDFEPYTEEVVTWNNVFNIRERYKNNVLDANFKDWLDDFGRWCKRLSCATQSDQEIIIAIDKYASYYEDLGISDRAFLRAATFRMLQKYCQQGDTRLILLIKDVVNGVVI